MLHIYFLIPKLNEMQFLPHKFFLVALMMVNHRYSNKHSLKAQQLCSESERTTLGHPGHDAAAASSKSSLVHLPEGVMLRAGPPYFLLSYE